MSIIDYNINKLLFALMMSFRFGAFFKAMPMFAEVKIPMVINVILPLGLAFILAPVLSYDIMPLMTMGTGSILVIIISEVLIGSFMGFAVNIVFVLASIVGELVGMQAGLAMASLFDPNLGQMPILGYYLRNFFLLFFFILNLHHMLIWMLAQSYETLPVGIGFMSFADSVPALVQLFSAIFLMAFRFALPVIILILLSHMTMGIIALTAPQMNMYFAVALTLNIVVAQIVFAMSLPGVFKFFRIGMGMLVDYITTFLLLAR